jgi:zinc protease
MPNIAFEKYTLPNGLDVILHEDHSIPMVSVNVWYKVGSQNEVPGRTGFAHLFEHVMFDGSKNHNKEYFEPIQAAGGTGNGSTSTDRTNYWENLPSNHLELALWLESDRMGFLLDALDEHRFDVERDVVKNERRQRIENQPYGLAGQEIQKAMFPPNHPYHWEVIGSQADLDAASLDDVKDFFRRFYAPNNASLSIAGDIDPAETKRLVEKYFADLAAAPPPARLERWVPEIDGEVRIAFNDSVQLRRIYLVWPGPPRFDADEAPLDVLISILGDGRSSRLHRSLVYEKQIARDITAYFGAMAIAGQIHLDATVVPTATVEDVEAGLLAEVRRLQDVPPSPEEVQRAINRIEAYYERQMESVGSFGGRADMLNYFNVFTGDPGRLNTELERYLAVTPADVQRVARTYFGPGRVRLLISPKEDTAVTPVEVDRTQRPAPRPEPAFRPPVPERRRLANGLDLLVIEKREVPVVSVAVHFAGGASLDPAERPGLASFTARMLTEGTKTRTSVQIADEADFIAAHLVPDTEREQTVATTESLTKHWPKALELLTDVLRNPVFPEREVERLRKERLTDLRRIKDDPTAIGARVEMGLLYGRETPHGHPMSGREAAIAALSRDELVSAHEGNILGGTPTFIVVGDVEADAVARQIETAFAGWRPAATPIEPPAATGVTQERTTIYLVDKPGAAQSVIAAAQLAVPRLHEDYLPLVVMNMAFGGQYTARLNMNLRADKGYTYGYRSRFDWRQSVSNFSCGGSVQTAVTKEALIETLKEIDDLQDKRPITEEEFEKAKGALIQGYPPTFETPGQVLRRLVDLVHFGLPDDYFTGQAERLAAVTLAEVRRAAAKHIDPFRLTILVVGDRATIEPGLQEIGLPIVHLDYEGQRLE